MKPTHSKKKSVDTSQIKKKVQLINGCSPGQPLQNLLKNGAPIVQHAKKAVRNPCMKLPLNSLPVIDVPLPGLPLT